MYHVISEEELRRIDESQRLNFERLVKEAEEKRRAREAILAAKCPTCGRHDPIPPWLQ